MNYIIAIGDTHINSTTALCKPNINLDDGGSYHLSKGQRWLWRNWLDFAGWVGGVVGANDVTLILNGDIVDADMKARSHQTITRNHSTIVRMAVETLEPLLEQATRVFIIRGTAAHVGKSAELEEQLAADIGAVKCPETDTYSWWTLDAEIGGVMINVMHHGRVGGMPWTRSNPMGALAVRLILSYSANHGRVPDLAIRSDRHQAADTGDTYPVRMLALPAWQLSTEYGSRLGIVELADIGGVIIACAGGEYEVLKRLYKPERARVWKL